MNEGYGKARTRTFVDAQGQALLCAFLALGDDLRANEVLSVDITMTSDEFDKLAAEVEAHHPTWMNRSGVIRFNGTNIFRGGDRMEVWPYGVMR